MDVDIERLMTKYGKVRADYVHAFEFGRVPKGSMRAFVGAKTCLYELSGPAAGLDERGRHVLAFEQAVADLHRELRDREAFPLALSRAIDDWRALETVPHRTGEGPPLLTPTDLPDAGMERDLTAVSLFSGAFGLDLGFMAAGFDLRFANDIDDDAAKTAERNLPDVPFAHADIGDVGMSEVLTMSGLSRGDVDVLIGGPPCQPFSTAGKRRGLNDPRASPLRAFVRAIEELQPRAFVMEEVTGLMSARLKHVTIAEREGRELAPEEERGSAFRVICDMLANTGYQIAQAVVDAADYGAPQSRRRLIFVGLREGSPSLPAPTHSNAAEDGLFGALPPWNTFWQAVSDLPVDDTEHAGISKKRAGYLALVPPGGNWYQLPEDVAEEAMGGAFRGGGGRMGFYRRLEWDGPSPTVVTSPSQAATMFCHPESVRSLTVREYKRVQGFPDDWELPGGIAAKYRLIGNAVPVHLSTAIAAHLQRLIKS
jgi:DNA (cytosine-5)-methyltransferase 1